MLSEITSDAVACQWGFVAVHAILRSTQAEIILCCPTGSSVDPSHLPATLDAIPPGCIEHKPGAQRPRLGLAAAHSKGIPLPTTLQTIPITSSSTSTLAAHADLHRRATTTSPPSAESTSSKTTSKTTSTTSSHSPTSTSTVHSILHRLKTWVKIVIAVVAIIFIVIFILLICCCCRCCKKKRTQQRSRDAAGPEMNANPGSMNGYGGGNAYGLGGASANPASSVVGLGLGVGGANGRMKENISGYEAYRGEAAARASLQEQREQAGLWPEGAGNGYGNGKGKERMMMSSMDLGQR